MPNSKAKVRKQKREELDKKFDKEGRTPGQIRRAKNKKDRKSPI